MNEIVTLLFSLLLIAVSIGSGTFAGLKGYEIGNNALRGVSQPEEKPQHDLVDLDIQAPPAKGELPLIPETEIIHNVNQQTNYSSYGD